MGGTSGRGDGSDALGGEIATEHIGVMESSWADSPPLFGICELSGFDLSASMDCTE